MARQARRSKRRKRQKARGGQQPIQSPAPDSPINFELVVAKFRSLKCREFQFGFAPMMVVEARNPTELEAMTALELSLRTAPESVN